MQNRRVVCVCNLKPAAMRGIVSQAMVLAATHPDTGKVGRGHMPVLVTKCPGMLLCYYEHHLTTSGLKQASTIILHTNCRTHIMAGRLSQGWSAVGV